MRFVGIIKKQQRLKNILWYHVEDSEIKNTQGDRCGTLHGVCSSDSLHFSIKQTIVWWREVGFGKCEKFQLFLSRSGVYLKYFFRYYKANFVGNSPPIETCDVSCIHMFYCAATKVDHEDYVNCAKTHASAFSASTSSAFSQLPASAAFISTYGPIILAFTIYRVR